MIVLADNDLILKLAQCDLLKDIYLLLGLENPNQIFVLPTARFQLLPKNTAKSLQKAGSELILETLRDFLAQTQELPPVNDELLLHSLEGFNGIDSGEQLLLASMLEHQDAILASGDKRALKCIAENKDELHQFYDSLLDRVLTFESCLLLALTIFGFPNLKQRLLGNPKPDGVLRLVLKEEMNERDLIECLVSYCRAHYSLLAGKAFLHRYFVELDPS